MFDALEWLAAMISDVPGKKKRMVRYYGYYRSRKKLQEGIFCHSCACR